MLRPWVLWSLASLLAAGPIVAYETSAIPDVDSAQQSAGGAWDKAYHDLFAPNASLTILAVESHPTRVGTFRETIRADPGYEFRYVRLRLANTGNVDMGAHTYQFSAIDGMGSETPAALANLHDDMEAIRIRAHGALVGTVIFEMPQGEPLWGVAWSGDLTNATALWSGR